MPLHRADARNILLCLLLGLAAFLLTWPFAEIGLNDDWSYIKTAHDLAATGRIVYNGWAAAMLGAQLYWGALFTLLFGKSFTAVRLSSVPLALLTVCLCYAVFRRSGVDRTPALLGALATGLSPLFVPYAVTFMSEMPCLALLLLTVYAFVRADEARSGGARPDGRAFLLWMIVGTIAGMTGGTVRQINWILALLAPLLMAIRIGQDAGRGDPAGRGRAGREAGACAVSLLLVGITAVAVSAWFAQQPYAVLEQAGAGVSRFIRLAGKNVYPITRLLAGIFYTLLLLCLPVLPLAPRLLWPVGEKKRTAVLTLAGAAVLFAVQWFLRLTPPFWQFPWMENTVTHVGTWAGLIPVDMRARPSYFSRGALFLLSFAVTALFTLIAAKSIRLLWARKSDAARRNTPFAVLLWGAFALIYLPMMVVKMFVPYSFGVFDRYLLPLLPGTILALLVYGRRENVADDAKEEARPKPILGYTLSAALTAVGGFWAVTATHDSFAEHRAAEVLAGKLESAGVPRQVIVAGVEYCGWTQVLLTGYYNDRRIQNPPNAYRTPPQNPANNYLLAEYTPDIVPVFFLTETPAPTLLNTAIPPEPIHFYLPPRRRYLHVQTADPRFNGLSLQQIADFDANTPQ